MDKVKRKTYAQEMREIQKYFDDMSKKELVTYTMGLLVGANSKRPR